MHFENIAIEKLIVNPNNDRHGQTPSEDTAIGWLFDHKASEMKHLATRIAKAGRIYDAPLVIREGSNFLVKDGNRRVTCLKLIHNPARAPQKFRNFFSDLKKNFQKSLATDVVCQVEDDQDIADEIIGLRHNGTQKGAGQLMWGPKEKAIHANRVSGKSDYEWPQLVENFLEERGYSDEAAAIKRSTLDRILKAKKRREQLGISLGDQRKIISTVAGYDPLALFIRFAHDMRDDKLTLKETLISADIDKYLARLRSEGLVPDKKSAPPKPAPPPPSLPNLPKPQPIPPHPTKRRRTSLIPSDVNYRFAWSHGQTKISQAWEQLQFELSLKRHKFSIAVVLRTLLEMVAKKYGEKNNLSDKGTLAKNLRLMADDLKEKTIIDPKTHEDVMRLISDTRSMVSIENLQRILHSTSQMPSEDDLITMWDCFEPLIVNALRNLQPSSK
ncbi:hypothetical protein [Celeribacter ethanolicus]|uniref:hypothetical protein n=1 Tax=Celeribacter ethanolicus TaxID=1758178 RepID=UPI0012FD2696|nr:hypothetical protein [Celeribacter ethanolicus]